MSFGLVRGGRWSRGVYTVQRQDRLSVVAHGCLDPLTLRVLRTDHLDTFYDTGGVDGNGRTPNDDSQSSQPSSAPHSTTLTPPG